MTGMIGVLVLVLLCLEVVETTHFNGGTITWTPVNPYDNSSSVMITIMQSYSWLYPSVLCDKNVPISTPSRVNQSADVKCVANCATQGGYSAFNLTVLTDCTSLSAPLSLMTSQRSVNITLAANAHFSIAYRGGTWVQMYSPTVTGLEWSVLCSIDIRMRDDGIINTPPVANIASPQYVIVNITYEITIHVSDSNIGDDVRCRWSQNYTRYCNPWREVRISGPTNASYLI
jgi:hypothetical protein